MDERAEGHYWVRFRSSEHWDVLFWRDGMFWHHQDGGYGQQNFEVGPRVHSPGETPAPAALARGQTMIVCRDLLAAVRVRRVNWRLESIVVVAFQRSDQLNGHCPQTIIVMPDVDLAADFGEGSLEALLRKRQLTWGSAAEFIRL